MRPCLKGTEEAGSMNSAKAKLLIVMPVFIFLTALLGTRSILTFAAQATTTIKVEPASNEFGNSNGSLIAIPGTNFTVTVKIYEATALYGLDLKFKWNTTFLRYLSHSVRVPKDNNAEGVLWNSILNLADEVNTTAGTYWIACASMWPAPPFNGSGTVFTMTFEIAKQPYDNETAADSIETYLDFSSTDLAQYQTAEPINHNAETATVTIWTAKSPQSQSTQTLPYVIAGTLATAFIVATTTYFVRKRRRRENI